MAMILCPECKQSISNQSKHCIHCGCPIYICPECGNITKNQTHNCTICGYTFEQKEPSFNQNSLLDSVKSFPNILKIIVVILSILTIACIGIALFKVIDWATYNYDDPSEALESLTNYKEIFNFTKNLILIGCCFFVLTSGFGLYKFPIFATLLGLKHTPDKKCFLAIEETRTQINTVSNKQYIQERNFNNLVLTHFMMYKTNPESKRKSLSLKHISFFFDILFGIFFYIFLISNLESFMKFALLSNEYSKFSIDSTYLWISIIMSIIAWLFEFCSTKRDKKLREEWYNLAKKKYKT